MQGCGSDSGEPSTPGATTPTPTPSPINQPPSITGTPPTTVTAGQAYTFTPQASDPEGTTLTFSIQNKPSWATFTGSNGRLTGTPTAAQVGAYANIRITVSDGTNNASLPAFSINVTAASPTTGSATLTWQPPTERTDGTALTNLAGYRIYYGNSPGNYPSTVNLTNPGLTTYVIDNLASGTWYFVMTSIDATGLESTQTNPVSKTI